MKNNMLALTVEEAAKELGISRRFCYQLIHEGRLPHVRLGQRRLLIPRSALEKFLEAQVLESALR